MYWYDGTPLNLSFWVAYVEYWLEEIPDPTAQLKADKVELLEALVQSDSIIRNRITGADTIEEAKFILDLRKKVEDFIKSNP